MGLALRENGSVATVEEGGWRRWVPGISVAIFLWAPVLALLDRDSLLRDPGTGWHLAAGRLMLETGRIPKVDPFSFTLGGKPWLTHEWLFQLWAGLAEKAGGLPMFTMSCAVLLGLVPLLVFRRAVAAGAGVVAALVAAFAVQIVLMGHAHARPHVATYALFAWASTWFYALDSGRGRWRNAPWLAPVFAVWANLHGGFVAGLVLCGSFFATAALGWLRWRGRPRLRRAGRWLALLGYLALATLINPIGWHLHAGILEAMGLRCLQSWSEYRSPDFLGGGINIRVFEGMFLAWVVVVAGRRRLRWAEFVAPAVFLHFALGSVRHVSLFCVLVAPILAREAGRILRRWWRGIAIPGGRWLLAERAPRQCWGWVTVLCVVLLWSSQNETLGMRRDLLGIRLSRGAAAFIENDLPGFRRAFNTEDLGGSLIKVFWPRIKVFVDDRCADLYGDDFMIGSYFQVAFARPGWKDVLDRWGVTSAILPRGATLVSLLRESPEWKEVYSDELNALFRRRE